MVYTSLVSTVKDGLNRNLLYQIIIEFVQIMA
uniref:Uncharacterized protein n=1 Tax=Anguilla anguilla TaxID=7936 RepID=A0A0E9RMM8_ANGAN